MAGVVVSKSKSNSFSASLIQLSLSNRDPPSRPTPPPVRNDFDSK